jgi:hypothetical protein
VAAQAATQLQPTADTHRTKGAAVSRFRSLSTAKRATILAALLGVFGVFAGFGACSERPTHPDDHVASGQLDDVDVGELLIHRLATPRDVRLLARRVGIQCLPSPKLS